MFISTARVTVGSFPVIAHSKFCVCSPIERMRCGPNDFRHPRTGKQLGEDTGISVIAKDKYQLKLKIPGLLFFFLTLIDNSVDIQLIYISNRHVFMRKYFVKHATQIFYFDLNDL